MNGIIAAMLTATQLITGAYTMIAGEDVLTPYYRRVLIILTLRLILVDEILMI